MKRVPPKLVLWVPSRNLPRAQKFYAALAGVLGWPRPRGGAQKLHCVFVPCGNVPVQLIVHPVARAPKSALPALLPAFSTAKMAGALKFLRKIKTAAAVEEFSHGRVARFKDPDGNVLELFELSRLPPG